MISDCPRVRFAPSPTGYLHVGGLRTALYNYLFAKKNNGKFILRIEDTDRNRYVEGAVENLISTLKWCGLDYDEGPDKQGEYGPYTQSERLEIYKKYALELVENGKAYYCFCTPERLTQLKEEQDKEKIQKKYDKHCTKLSKEEVAQKLSLNEPYVIRLNVQSNEIIKIKDIVRGDVEFNSDTVDDQVLLKSDGFPTYHLANVVDDHLMKITHVVRGEEWLPSTPKHILLYQYLGWEIPEFAHLPLLLNPDRTKLSKRQGDVAVEDYRTKGFLKEALVNFVALLGWNAGDDKEFYSLKELEEAFSLERVNKSGAVFDLQKLNWLNAEHLRKKKTVELVPVLREDLQKNGVDDKAFSDSYLSNIIDALRERISFVKEIYENSSYFFKAPDKYDEVVLKKRWNENSVTYLEELKSSFERVENDTKEEYENALKATAEKLNTGAGSFIHPLRLATSGVGNGPGVYDIVYILGKEETIKRINKAIEVLG